MKINAGICPLMMFYTSLALDLILTPDRIAIQGHAVAGKSKFIINRNENTPLWILYLKTLLQQSLSCLTSFPDNDNLKMGEEGPNYGAGLTKSSHRVLNLLVTLMQQQFTAPSLWLWRTDSITTLLIKFFLLNCICSGSKCVTLLTLLKLSP